MLGFSRSECCVSPKKMVKKSIAVKNSKENIELLSKSKTHDATFLGTGRFNITSNDMFKSIELPVKRKMLQEQQQLKIGTCKLLEIEEDGKAIFAKNIHPNQFLLLSSNLFYFGIMLIRVILD